MAVWQNTKIVVIGLSVLLAGQLGISIRAMTALKGRYPDDYSGCMPKSVEFDVAAAMFLTAMLVDFVILSLTLYKTYVGYKGMCHSSLIKLIFRDGLVYFVVV